MNVAEIIALVLIALGAGAFIYLLPQIRELLPRIAYWIETHTTSEERDVLVNFAGIVVDAAEQLFGPKTGEQKKAYAMELLGKLMPQVDEDVRSAAIEGKVFERKTAAE